MKKIDLRITVQVNKVTGSVSAVYFQIRRGHAKHVKELAEGKAFANYDFQQRLLGIELLAPCEVTVLDRLTRGEPAPVKNFLRKSIPREMAIA